MSLDILSMLEVASTYPSRKVDLFREGDLIISTVKVPDLRPPFLFETAIRHPEYNNNHLVIVEEYATQEEAKNGHAKWIGKMTSGGLPDVLMDVSTSSVCGLMTGDSWREMKRKNIPSQPSGLPPPPPIDLADISGFYEEFVRGK